MLTELRIRNFAIIDSVVLPLAPGLNVLSGETGAGKSIIVGALGLLIGERATADMVRTGADRAVVEGTFDIGAAAELRALLDDRGIDCDEDTLVLRREVSATSGARARAWINGTAVTATVLADIGRALVNVHGQHEAQSLLDPEAQRRILDAFAGALAQADTVARAHAALTAARHAVAQLKARRDDAQRRADYLQHVAREIGDALLVEGEEQRLDDEARRLTHAEELRALAGEITGVLEGEETSVLHQLGTLQRALGALQRIDPSVARLQELYDASYYALQELVREASAYGEGIEHDPARLAELERRRDLVFRLVKKYGGSIASVLETGREARAELALLDTAALDLRELDARVSAAVAALQEAAAGLTTARRQAASLLEQQVEAQFSGLGLAEGRFHVVLAPRAEIGAVGAEDVEFRVALNVGHEARALSRVASGGELSRVMLALKTILARVDGVPTLIFDEVDAGIGGKVGQQVGDAMRRVADHHQVFAITHLPQIASRAHHHIRVMKGARGGVTTADIEVLVGDARVEEIARMLGGDADSATSRAHAREQLATATIAAVDTPPAAKAVAPAVAPATGPRGARTSARSPRRG
ncbi:MAG TPA: DNA repair protein RecN [Gemmatimonadaceae bacterium]